MWPQFFAAACMKALFLPLTKAHLSNVATFSWQTGWAGLIRGGLLYITI